MRIFSKLLFLTFFLMLCAVAASAQSQPKTTPTQPKTTTTDPAVKPTPEKAKGKIEFPEITGWTKGKITEYPAKELGYSVPYNSDRGVIVTIYVYNGGNKTIPNELTGIVGKEMSKAQSDLYALEERGVYQNVKEIKSDKVVLGGTDGKVNALRSLFSFTIQGRDVNSEIILFPYQNNFIKIRATRPKTLGKEAENELAELLGEIDVLFAN